MLHPYLKAVYGAVVAGVAAALAYYQGGGTSTHTAILVGLGAGLSALGVVWAVPNATKGSGSGGGK